MEPLCWPAYQPDGTGQVLLFPMYNADNGNATNVHIVNTTANVKAVKVRFPNTRTRRSSRLQRASFKNDHFAFGVIKDPNGTGAAVIPLIIAVLFLRWAQPMARSLVLRQRTPMARLREFSPSLITSMLIRSCRLVHRAYPDGSH